jgi:hypothetical protein
MPAIASLEELKMVRRDFRSMFLAASPNDLRLTIYGNILTLCAMRSALCFFYGHETRTRSRF